MSQPLTSLDLVVTPIFTDISINLSRVLLFFFRFAWQVKVRLPILLTVAFLAFDIRIRVEIEVQF